MAPHRSMQPSLQPSMQPSMQWSPRLQVEANFAGTPRAKSEEPAERGSSSHVKSITFIRHGKSAGNAHIYGIIEKGDIYAYRDCQLVQDGERQVGAFVDSLDEDGLRRIVDAEVVMVSPLARAMATAVLVLARARHRLGSLSSWPRVEVVTELREKVKSDSERPGTNSENSLAYVRRIANSIGQRLFGDRCIMDPVMTDICCSYKFERERSNNWQPEPQDASSFMAMIEIFKGRLSRKLEQNFLLVGHSGWARFAFSAFLPSVNEERQSNNLQAGARQICPLGNCGAVHAFFKDLMFHDVSVRGIDYDNAPKKRAVARNSKHKRTSAPIMCLEEAKMANVVPDDAILVRMHLDKRTKSDAFKRRLFTFSCSAGIAHLAWADKWGKPRNSIPINDGRLAWTKYPRSQTFLLSHPALDKDKVIQLRAGSREDFDKFAMLLSSLQDRPQSRDNGIAPPLVYL